MVHGAQGAVRGQFVAGQGSWLKNVPAYVRIDPQWTVPEGDVHDCKPAGSICTENHSLAEFACSEGVVVEAEPPTDILHDGLPVDGSPAEALETSLHRQHTNY